MKVFEKIRRHAAVSSGDFAAMFKNVDIPPLPAALTQLVEEINRSEPDLSRIAKLVSSSAGLASKVVRTINSAMFSVKRPVGNVHQALVLLGLGHIRQIVLAYATMEALPKPHGDFFNDEAFWTDSLLQAILARSLAKNRFHDQLDDVSEQTSKRVIH